MTKSYFLFIFFLCFSLYAKDSFNFIHIRESFKFQENNAVLVLAPSMNTDGSFFLKEPPWVDFAKKNNLAVIALSYSSAEKDL